MPKPKIDAKIAGGWSTQRALLLAAATGGLAYAIAVLGDGRRGGIRDYADPGKFTVPRYANIRDMEMVSF